MKFGYYVDLVQKRKKVIYPARKTIYLKNKANIMYL